MFPLWMMMKWNNNNIKFSNIELSFTQSIWYTIFLISRDLLNIYTANYQYAWRWYYLYSWSPTSYTFVSQQNHTNTNQTTALWLNNDWTKIYSSTSSSTNYDSCWNLWTPYNINTASFFAIDWNVNTQYKQILFWDNWNKLFLRLSDNTTNEYNLSVPFDRKSLTLVWNYNVWFIQFNEDGSKFYTVDNNNLYEYYVNTTFSLSWWFSLNRTISLWTTISTNWIFNINIEIKKLVIVTNSVNIHSFNLI